MSAAAGTVKETVGNMIGNRSMEAEGKAQHAAGNAEYEQARAQGYASGVMNSVSGNVKHATGNVLGNERLQAEGKAEHVKGEAKKEVNSH